MLKGRRPWRGFSSEGGGLQGRPKAAHVSFSTRRHAHDRHELEDRRHRVACQDQDGLGGQRALREGEAAAQRADGRACRLTGEPSAAPTA